MTTIAYKDGIIAYDSRLTHGDIIKTDTANKKYDINGVSFFCSGSPSDIPQFVNWWFTGENPDDISLSAFVYDGKLWQAGTNNTDGPWKTILDVPYAIGSGMDFAIGAMDMGASAKEAVQVASKRDIYTGGKIKEFRVR